MKTLSVLIGAFLPFLLLAQSWQPIKPGHLHHFLPEGDTVIHTIWVDSTTAIGADTVFYLNRTLVPSNPRDERYFALNQPHFLMREMVKKGDSLYQFRDTAAFSIYTHLGKKEGRTFRLEAGLEATLEIRKDSSYWGIKDSIQRFRLNDGQLLILSKSYGILQFPSLGPGYRSWKLIGIEGPDSAGLSIPTFADYHRFEVGDVFEYCNGYSYFSSRSIWKVKQTILSIPVASDSLFQYRVRFVSRVGDIRRNDLTGQDDTIFYNGGRFVDTLTLNCRNYPEHPTNGYSFQLLTSVQDTNSWFNGRGEFCRVILRTDGEIVRQLGRRIPNEFSPQFPYYTSFRSSPLNIFEGDLFANWYGNITYRVGKGMTYHRARCGICEGQSDTTLIAYRTATDSFGIITPDSILLSAPTSEGIQSSLTVYPNPTSSYLDLAWEKQILGNEIVVYLRNGQGQVVAREKVAGGRHRWDLPALSVGVYWLQVEGHGGGISIRYEGD